MPAGIVMSCAVAFVFGLLALRTRGSYFLMITLRLRKWCGDRLRLALLTGGDDGFPKCPDRTWEQPCHWPIARTSITSSSFFVAIGALAPLPSRRHRLSVTSLRASEKRNAILALGYNVWRYKLAAFVLGAAFAGLRGSLYVYYNRFRHRFVHVPRSAEVLLMVILGGTGPAVGATLIVLLENIISTYTERWLILLGVVYVRLVPLAPTPLAGQIPELSQAKDQTLSALNVGALFRNFGACAHCPTFRLRSRLARRRLIIGPNGARRRHSSTFCPAPPPHPAGKSRCLAATSRRFPPYERAKDGARAHLSDYQSVPRASPF